MINITSIEEILEEQDNFVNNFKQLEYSDMVYFIANIVYTNTILDPEGYPSTKPSFDELSDNDKYCFMNSAHNILHLLGFLE